MEEMGVVRGQGGRPCSEEQLLQDRAAGSAGLTGCTERSHKEKSATTHKKKKLLHWYKCHTITKRQSQTKCHCKTISPKSKLHF